MPTLDDNTKRVNYSTHHTFRPPAVTNALMISCSFKAVARFDRQRGNLSRREYLDELMDLADGDSDYGEIKY